MSEYQFTKDWFNWAPEVWTQLIPLLPARQRFLEIGSFEGRSTVWIVENMLDDGGYIDCIDTWKGGEEHSAEDMAAVEARFDHNLDIAKERSGIFDGDTAKKIFKFKGPATAILGAALCQRDCFADMVEDEAALPKPMYDFIYIDGSHIAKDVLTDACMAWPLLKPKGMMVFDDYMWGNPRDILHRPKPAIDAFCNIFAEEAEIVHVGYQLVVRKKGE
jgi:predicted O-methyltransferase YrrM